MSQRIVSCQEQSRTNQEGATSAGSPCLSHLASSVLVKKSRLHHPYCKKIGRCKLKSSSVDTTRTVTGQQPKSWCQESIGGQGRPSRYHEQPSLTEEPGVEPRVKMDSGRTESPDSEFGWQVNKRNGKNK